MRLLVLLIIAAISIVITLIKKTAGHVVGSDDLSKTTVKKETANLIDKTARGVGWMEQQWEAAKNRSVPEGRIMGSFDERVRERATQELLSENCHPQTLQRALSDANHDAELGALLYVKYRSEDLKQGKNL